MYDDPRQPARAARPPQGQRCPACGHLEPDAAARFCGVCGAAFPGAPVAVPTPAYGAGPAGTSGYGPRPAPPMPYDAPVPPIAASASTYGFEAAASPEPVTYTIPSVGFAGPARVGAAVSAAFALVPCVLFAFIGAWAIHAARRLLDSWLTASISVPIPFAPISLPMNFVDLLRLRSLYDTLIYWDDRLWLAFAIFWLVPWALWIVAGAIFALLLAAIYNTVGAAGGGIRVKLAPIGTLGRAAGPGGAAYQPPPEAWSSGPAAVPPPGGWQQPDWPPDRRR